VIFVCGLAGSGFEIDSGSEFVLLIWAWSVTCAGSGASGPGTESWSEFGSVSVCGFESSGSGFACECGCGSRCGCGF